MKKSGWLIIGIVVVVLLVGMAIVMRMVSTFVAQKASDKITETVYKTATGGNVDINSSNGSVSINTEDGSATFGNTNSLPKDFPSDIPTPMIGTISGSYSANSEDGQAYTVAYTLTAAQAASASSDYQTQLKAAGYTVDNTTSSTSDGDTFELFSAKKGDRNIVVTTSTSSDGTATMSLVVSIDSTN
ncbi:MAG: hypothetical protein Q7T74_02080 [Candidatus Saccharibacteria bacterium]|nr:hypothetical protein [Candidatus Saccharibacteria bacterium]